MHSKYAQFIDYLLESHGGISGMYGKIIPAGTSPEEFLGNLLRYEETHLPAWMVSHQHEVTVLAYTVGESLGYRGPQLADIGLAARFHDIGKSAVDIDIIQHAGKLRLGEYEKIKEHIRSSHLLLKEKSRLSPSVLQIVLYHHEYFDGSGYPEGLGGQAIPEGARLLSLVDSFSAMLGSRPYPNENGRNIISAFQEIERGRGTLYDPEMASQFIRFLHHAFIAWVQDKKYEHAGVGMVQEVSMA